jgi:uncharacterized membrane protein SirB2
MVDLLWYLQAPMRWTSIGDWNNPSRVMLVVLIYCSLGTYILSRTVSGARSVTAPICFWVLFACSMAANKYLSVYRLPSTNELQHIMVYTTAGVVFGSIVLLATLRAATRGEG